MKRICKFILLLLFPLFAVAQDYYYPPLSGDTWETMTATEAGWCADEISPLYDFLEEKNTKAFIILKDGKIVAEKYFDTFEQDSVWYWASVGKSLTSFLVGVAQEEEILEIDDRTSEYLGEGWTSAPLEKENLITLKHQLSMNTGLDFNVSDLNCMTPDCLNYLADAGTQWYYHNAPYRLLQDVIANASGQTFQNYTLQKLTLQTGITGVWFNRVFYSKPRSLARFGSLVLKQGNWDGNSILGDTDYLTQMVNTSQDDNLSYGYLWWLNGKGTHKLPQLQLTFNTDIVPNAPAEMYCALGKNDQKLYIVPSKNIVVVRMGEASGNSAFAVSSFDNELWGMLGNVFCEATATSEILKSEIKVFPNPVNELLYFQPRFNQRGRHGENEVEEVKIFNAFGQQVGNKFLDENQIDVSNLAKGTYWIQFLDGQKNVFTTSRFVKM